MNKVDYCIVRLAVWCEVRKSTIQIL